MDSSSDANASELKDRQFVAMMLGAEPTDEVALEVAVSIISEAEAWIKHMGYSPRQDAQRLRDERIAQTVTRILTPPRSR